MPPPLRALRLVLAAFGLLLLAAGSASASDGAPLITELVVDPQTDWDGSGAVTTSDEWVELHNPGNSTLLLDGLVLEFADSTTERLPLSGTLAPGAFLVVLNPPGQQNNEGSIALLGNGTEFSRVAYGSGGLPDGNAASTSDESLHPVAGGLAKGASNPGRPEWAPHVALSAGGKRLGPGLVTNRSPLSVDVLLRGGTPGLEAILLAGPDQWRLAANGSFERTVRLDVGLAEGPNALRLLLVHPDGRAHLAEGDPFRGPWTAVLDTRAPDAPPLTSPGPTRSEAVRLTWPLPPVDVQIRLLVDWGGGEVAADCPSPGSCALPAPAGNGTFRASARIEATDGAGNAALGAAVDLLVDREGPLLDPARLRTGGSARDAWAEWEPAFDAGVGVASYRWALVLPDGALLDEGERSVSAGRLLLDGLDPFLEPLLRLAPIDGLGNQGAPVLVPLARDLVPRVAAVAQAEGALPPGVFPLRVTFDRLLFGTGSATLRLRALAADGEPLDDVALRLDGTRLVPLASGGLLLLPSYTVPAAGAALALELSLEGLVDAAGRPLGPTPEVHLVDLAPPRISATPAGGWLSARNATVTLVVTDAADPSPDFSVSLDGRPLAAPPATECGAPREGLPASCRLVLHVPVAGEGNHTLRISASDASGREARWEGWLGLDATAPEVSLAGLDPATGLWLVSLHDDGSGVARLSLAWDAPGYHRESSLAPTGTSARFAPPADLPRATVWLNATATDRAGNSGTGLLAVFPPGEAFVAEGRVASAPLAPQLASEALPLAAAGAALALGRRTAGNATQERAAARAEAAPQDPAALLAPSGAEPNRPEPGAALSKMGSHPF